jgi:hypothetical protein
MGIGCGGKWKQFGPSADREKQAQPGAAAATATGREEESKEEQGSRAAVKKRP